MPFDHDLLHVTPPDADRRATWQRDVQEEDFIRGITVFPKEVQFPLDPLAQQAGRFGLQFNTQAQQTAVNAGDGALLFLPDIALTHAPRELARLIRALLTRLGTHYDLRELPESDPAVTAALSDLADGASHLIVRATAVNLSSTASLRDRIRTERLRERHAVRLDIARIALLLAVNPFALRTHHARLTDGHPEKNQRTTIGIPYEAGEPRLAIGLNSYTSSLQTPPPHFAVYVERPEDYVI